MENDEYLTKFQGALFSLSMNGLLHKPPDGSQTGEEIKKREIEELSKFVAKLPSFAKCKIAYYMILNTELIVSCDIKNDEFIGLFVNITPGIPLQALIKWIHALDLFNEFCKVIENSPAALGKELIDAVLENASIACSTNFYFTLWCSVFKKICKIEKKNNSESPAKLKYYFIIISEKVVESLDLSEVTCKNLQILEEFLMTVLSMVMCYKNPGSDDEMYKLNIEFRVTEGVEVPNEECINFMFKTIYSILKTFSFEEFSSNYAEEWKIISSLFNRLLNEVETVEGSAAVLKILSKLAVNESHAGIKSLIVNAENGQKCNWARVVGECYDCPLHKMNNEDLDMLLHEAFERLETSGEEMKELFLAAVTHSNSHRKWLEMVFDKYQPNLLTTSNTDKDLIETFNRISNTESIPADVIIPLCMQSPLGTIKGLCQLAITARTADLRVFQELKPACQVLLPTGITLLDDVIFSLLSEELTASEEDSFRHFIVKLRKQNLIGLAFLENLIKELKEFLGKDEMNKAILCLTVMDSILVETEVNIIALLVFVSQVLGYFSWDLGTFSTVKANGRDAVCSIVRQLMAKMNVNTDREILNRTREEILKCWEVNQACFCDLWFRFGKTWHGSGKFDSLILALIHSSCSRRDLRRFLLTCGPPDEVRISIVLALIKILPVLALNLWRKTMTELTEVWIEVSSHADDEVFKMFVSAWYLLTLQLNKDNDIQNCYMHCLAGFGKLFTCARLKGESFVRIYENILFIMKSIEDEEIRKSCLVIMLPVLRDKLVETSKEGAEVRKMERILNEEFKS